MHPLTFQSNTNTYKLQDIKQLLAQQQLKKKQLHNPTDALIDVTNENLKQSRDDLAHFPMKQSILKDTKAKFFSSEKISNLDEKELATNFLGHQAFNHRKSNWGVVKRPKENSDDGHLEHVKANYKKSKDRGTGMSIEKSNKDELKMCFSDVESNHDSQSEMSYVLLRNRKSRDEVIPERLASTALIKSSGHTNITLPTGALPGTLSNGNLVINTRFNRNDFNFLVDSTHNIIQEPSALLETDEQKNDNLDQFRGQFTEIKENQYIKKQSIIKKDRALNPFKSMKSVKFSEHFENYQHSPKATEGMQRKLSKKLQKKACCLIF